MLGGHDVKTFGAQLVHEDLADVRVILDDEHQVCLHEVTVCTPGRLGPTAHGWQPGTPGR
jgi:hypothetical protein